MTAAELLKLALRRWYILLLGAALTVGAAWSVAHPAGVYWTRSDVTLLPPAEFYYPNQLEDPQYSLAALAGLVASEYNGSDRLIPTSSSDTTLYGLGERSGVDVRVPNLGNQWVPLYTSPTIAVQVVDSDPAVVAEKLQEAVARLDQLLTAKQDDLHIAPGMRATLFAPQTEPSVYYVAGSRPRAFGGMVVLGIALTLMAVYLSDRIRFRRRRTAERARSVTAASRSQDRPTTSRPVRRPSELSST
ncbi:MAG TPA: hypothetical protein PKY70_05125 [Nakamurella multipartita]|nr:hypothetical protein [Nakamurella multipartita]